MYIAFIIAVLITHIYKIFIISLSCYMTVNYSSKWLWLLVLLLFTSNYQLNDNNKT